MVASAALIFLAYETGVGHQIGVTAYKLLGQSLLIGLQFGFNPVVDPA